MTNLKLPTLGLSLVLLMASCSKNDIEEISSDAALSSAVALSTMDTVGWKSANVWETADQETFSVRYFTIADPAITADVADNGLVLLFKRTGSAINALPFEESATESTDQTTNANYWYHQITEGSLLVSCDVYTSKTNTDATSAFKYFVITPEKLQTLEADGHTTEELMSLSYADASSLLNAAQ